MKSEADFLIAAPIVMASGQSNAPIFDNNQCPALTCLHEAPIVAHSLRAEGFDASEDGTGRGTPLKAQSGQTGKGDAAPLTMTESAVRRLTPRECERLQGFPDDFTLVPYRGKPAADGNRYKALGNSMAVPVMRWIGERIQMVEAIAAEQAAA